MTEILEEDVILLNIDWYFFLDCCRLSNVKGYIFSIQNDNVKYNCSITIENTHKLIVVLSKYPRLRILLFLKPPRRMGPIPPLLFTFAIICDFFDVSNNTNSYGHGRGYNVFAGKDSSKISL